MLFNSLEFLIFFPLVYILYWFFFNKSLKYQNIVILISSYVFYGWWDYRFLGLILLSTLVDYFIGKLIPAQKDNFKKKILLYLSVGFNLGILGFFKYYNFFIESLNGLFTNFNFSEAHLWTLNIILPVGISFYTFQTMSYTLDIYRGNLKPTDNFISFASFVAFFPQLVAGPIERATKLLPQISQKRKFSHQQSLAGIKLMIWGFFKKVVIADSLAPTVDIIFSEYSIYDTRTLIIGAIFFAFQIYCDFSGYSDIAIGLSKLFGFELMSNFKYPYFSRNIGEFWRRWHISLSTWFRDYIYIPLGGSRNGKKIAVRNIFIIFLVSGIWHGANWTFLFWGFFHALLFLPSFLFNTNRTFNNNIIAENSLFPSFKETLYVITNFCLVTIGWIFFRSDSITSAFGYLSHILSNNGYTLAIEFNLFIYLTILLILEYVIRRNERCIKFSNIPQINKFIFIVISVITILLFFKEDPSNFIYFQF